MEDIFPNLGTLSKGSRIAVLSGAGISAESGISTFRDNGGLWEKHNIYEVASPQAWQSNPSLVLRFYNERRKQLLAAEPNDAHRALALLQDHFHTEIITQNIDDLHERAGSKNVLHLHGELLKSRSSANASLIYNIEGWEICEGDTCELGSQLRPHVVWFGEEVPAMAQAQEKIAGADLLVVVGTSLNVYPAAGLLYEVRPGVPVIAIDPAELDLSLFGKVYHLREKAGAGLKKLLAKLLK